MEDILIVLYSLPFWVYIVDSLAVGLAAFLITVVIISKTRLARLLDTLDANGESLRELRRDYSVRQLTWHTRYIERKARESGVNLPELLGITDVWIAELERRKNRTLFRRVLTWAPEKGLFLCFLETLDNESYTHDFLTWMEEHKRIGPLRILAVSAAGRNFSGVDAWAVLSAYAKDLRALAQDQDSDIRFFSLQILLYDPDPHSQMLVWRAFSDPDVRVRELVVMHMRMQGDSSEADEKLERTLVSLCLNDVAPTVRRAAKRRLSEEFSVRFDYGAMHRIQAIHLLELLNTESEEDRKTALYFLENGDLEQRRISASYLERAGVLRDLFMHPVPAEDKGFERTKMLLSHACDAGITAFLSPLVRTFDSSKLFLGLFFLKNGMRPELSRRAAKRVFFRYPLWKRGVMNDELYCAAFDALVSSPDAQCRRILCREVQRRRRDREYLSSALMRMEGKNAWEFLPLLLMLLKSADFSLREELFRVLKAYPKEYLLPELFSIMRRRYPLSVQSDVMRLLSQCREPFCVQQLLEGLPALDPAVSQEIFSTLFHIFPDEVRRMLEFVFTSCDARLKAQFLLCIPSVSDPALKAYVYKGLTDDDKHVRLQALKALKEYGDTDLVSLVRQLLVDPVPEVRMLAASYLAEYAEEAETLKCLLSDKGQEEDFKKAILAGLSASQTRAALDVLLWSLSATPELIRSAIEALSRRTCPLDVEYILKAYSTSDMRERSLIAKSFSLMYSVQRDVSCLTDFLGSQNQAVRSSASEILEYTGWVEEQKRALTSFSSETRLATVKRLSAVHTFSAFQGILCAARDPDRRVREEAFRALRGFPEKLMRDFRKRIAETPDTKIRTVAEKVFLNLR